MAAILRAVATEAWSRTTLLGTTATAAARTLSLASLAPTATVPAALLRGSGLASSSRPFASASPPASSARSFASSSQSASSSQAAAPEAAAAAAGSEPAAPWTASSALAKRKVLTKRMSHLIRSLEEEAVASSSAAQRGLELPSPGDLVEVRSSVPENRRRPASFRGIVIAVRSRSLRSSFTVRNHFGPGGVERSFMLHSPHIEEIKILGSRKPRRAKLYYLRDRLPKEYRVA